MASSDQAAQPPSGTPSMPESLRRLSVTNPIVFSSTAWAALCVGYAIWQVPEAPLNSPELLREQLQLRIRSIPVPSSSPRYQQFKEYYTREHDLQLQEYKVAHKKWQQSTAAFNWRAFAQGLGVGVLILSAAFAVLEYHYGAISYWMQVAEELWCDAQQKRQKRLQLADSAKMERLLQEMGEGADDAVGKGPSKRRKPDGEARQRVKSPSPSETKASGIPPPQALPTTTSPTAPKEEAPKADAAPRGAGAATTPEAKPAPPAAVEPRADNPTLLQGSSVPSTFGSSGASRLRERLRCKVIERHRQQAEQATTPSSQEGSNTGPEMEQTEPAPKKEKKSKNKKDKAKKEEPAAAAKMEPEAKPEEPAPPAPEPAPALEKEAPAKSEQAPSASKKGKNGKAKKAEAKAAESSSRAASKETPAKPASTQKADPEVQEALQRLARQPLATPALRGPELLREAQELLSRLEAEDLLKQLETEEEHARRAAGKKKAKKNKAAARAKASAKKGAKSEAPAEQPKPELQGAEEADTEEEEEQDPQEEIEEAVPERQEIKMDDKAEEKETGSSVEDSTEIHSSDGQDSHTSSAPSDEERSAKKTQERYQVAAEHRVRTEDPCEVPAKATQHNSEPSFNGALAGAQILDFLRSGQPEKEPVWAEAARKGKKSRQSQQKEQKEPQASAESSVRAKAVATPQLAEIKMDAKVEEKESGSSVEDSTEIHSSDGQDSHSSSTSDEERFKKPEATVQQSNECFNGALAGAQILDYLRSGKSHKEPRSDSVWKGKSKSWPSQPKEADSDACVAESSLRAEAPEFVPGQSVSESPLEECSPVLPNMVMADQLPIPVMVVPVQMFEAMVPVMGMQPPSSGMQLPVMAMPVEMQQMVPQMESAGWAPPPEAGDADTSASPAEDEAEKEPAAERSGCEDDDDCDSVFGEPPVMQRQMTI
ncbi:unnamed protein product [Symbiodinium natans]|uniref:Uncharacterized protein n=1 Tax=Symbiodinium natans TaxID=878477 RepID=A0A812S279_9DINO|nr:unnamed protein product [Symbiodinium natans]